MGLKRVKSGEPIRAYPAADFNTLVDAAEWFQGRMLDGGSRPGRGGSAEFDGTVVVRNDSGAHRKRFEVLAIEGIIISPAQNLPEFQRAPAFACGLPAADSAKLVILVEPVRSGRLGRALIQGVSAVQVDMQDAGHEFADPTDADATKLTSADSGAFRILYVETGTGTKWAAVQWPVGGATGTISAKFDGTRSGRCYTGHVLNSDGTLGAEVQFVIDNDPGTYSLPANTIVTAEKAPARLADAAIWSGSGDKYRAISTAPFSQLT